MTHSPLFLIIPKLWLPEAITHPTSEGVNSITVCQPIVMMLALSRHLDETSTIGPGSRYRRTWPTGNALFLGGLVMAPAALIARAERPPDTVASRMRPH